MRNLRPVRPGVALILIGFCVVPAFAQDLPVGPAVQLPPVAHIGDRIFVIDRQGREIHGVVKRASAASITIDANGIERDVAGSDIGRIEKPVRGLVGGVAGGALAGLLLGAERRATCSTDCARVVPGAGIAGAVVGAMLGARIDRAIRGHSTVYRANAAIAAGPVHSFRDLWMHLKTGDDVRVAGPNGSETRATFSRADASAISLLVRGRLRQMSPSDVREIARRGQSERIGAMIGVAVGSVVGLRTLGCVEPSRNQCGSSGDRVSGALFRTVLYGLAGAGFGALVPSGTTVYAPARTRSVELSPILSTHGRGLRVSMSF